MRRVRALALVRSRLWARACGLSQTASRGKLARSALGSARTQFWAAAIIQKWVRGFVDRQWAAMVKEETMRLREAAEAAEAKSCLKVMLQKVCVRDGTPKLFLRVSGKWGVVGIRRGSRALHVCVVVCACVHTHDRALTQVYLCVPPMCARVCAHV